MHFPVIYYNQSSIAKIQRLFLEEDVIRTTIPTNAILTILKNITHSDFKTANKHSNYKSSFYDVQCSVLSFWVYAILTVDFHITHVPYKMMEKHDKFKLFSL